MAGMACAFFLYAATGLVAPWWGVVVLLGVWVLLLVVACAWWTPHPRWVPWVAVFAIVLVVRRGVRRRRLAGLDGLTSQAAGRTLTRVIRCRSTSVTTSWCSPTTTVSPTSASRPSWCMT